MDQPSELGVWFCNPHLIWKAVPYPGRLWPEGPQPIPGCIYPWDFCLFLCPEIISWCFNFYQVIYIFWWHLVYNFENLTCHLFYPTYMKRLCVCWFEQVIETWCMVIIYESQCPLLNFFEFVSACCTTKMPSKGAVAKIWGYKRVINYKFSLLC